MTAARPRHDKDLLRLYLADIGRYPLLTKEDEARLAQEIEQGKAARATLAERDDLPRDERRWLERTVRHGDEAWQTFVRSNLKLVVAIARTYEWSGVSALDLIQEGNLGLMHAVGKFDWRLGFRFSTYASWWIRQAIERGIANIGSSVRLPGHVADVTNRIAPVRNAMEARLGRPVTRAELADELGVSEQQLTALSRAATTPMSFSEPITEDGITLDDVLEDAEAVRPSDAAATATMPRAIEKLLAPLPERERKVISLRVGLDRGTPRTCGEVAEHFSLTGERIRQIEVKALAQLRELVSEDDLRDLLSA